jgi:adenylate kinase family enzyme
MTSRKVRLLRLVVASPGDVQRERDIVQEVASEIDREYGSDLGLHIEVVRWETDAFPAFDPQGPQKVIDSVLNIADCDILVGIFWKRFGTPALKANSGTEHEIQTAYESWLEKQSPNIMLYFNTKPYSPKTGDEAKQWAEVLDFRQRSSVKGLWWPYNGPSHFQRVFHSHLSQVVKRLATPASAQPSERQISPDSHEIEDRNAYISRYQALIAESATEIVLSTSKLHRSERSPDAKVINTSLRKAHERGVDVRILVADGYDRLPGALEVTGELGIALRFDPNIHFSDVNYACFDRRAAIVAARTPSATQADYRRSFSWVEFRSEALAAALVNDFEHQWKSPISRSVTQYLREILPTRLPANAAGEDIDRVAHHLAIPPALVEAYLRPKAAKIFLLGRPGSGKTTVARAVKEAVESTGAAGSVKLLSDAAYLWRIFRASGPGDDSVEPTKDGGYLIKDPALYQRAAEDLAKRAKRMQARATLLILELSRRNYIGALETLERAGVELDLIVYLNVDLETALRRNRQRAMASRGDRHYVSEQEMRTTFASDDLDELKKKYKGRILVLSEAAEPAEPAAVRGHAAQILERMKD